MLNVHSNLKIECLHLKLGKKTYLICSDHTSKIFHISRCPKCSSEVYAPEKVHVGMKQWHKCCLVCEQCTAILDAAHLNEVKEKVKQKGMNFDHEICYSFSFCSFLFFRREEKNNQSRDQK